MSWEGICSVIGRPELSAWLCSHSAGGSREILVSPRGKQGPARYPRLSCRVAYGDQDVYFGSQASLAPLCGTSVFPPAAEVERHWCKPSEGESLPPPDTVGVAVLHLRRDVIRLAVADGAEHGYPVQQFAADIAGFEQLMLRRFGDQPIDLLLFERFDHAHRP